MENEKIFKISIWASVLTSVLFYMISGHYTGDIAEAMEWHGYGKTLPNWLSEALMFLWFLIPLSTLNFNIKARNLYLFLALSGVLTSLFNGVSAYTHLEMTLIQVSLIADAVALTLAFTTLKHRFNSTVENSDYIEQTKI